MLKGNKVVLRALRRTDLDRLNAFNNDLQVELAGGGDPPMPQPLARLQAEFDAAASKGGRDDANFAIEVDGQFVGICALFNFDWTGRSAELGLTIGDPNFWGQGYGSEAVRLLTDYGFRYRNLRKIWLRVHGVNSRAQRTYRKFGFIKEGELRSHVYANGSYDSLILMGILRSEWKALTS